MRTQPEREAITQLLYIPGQDFTCADWNVSSAGVVFNLSNNMFYGLLNTSLDRFKMIDLSSNFLEGEVLAKYNF